MHDTEEVIQAFEKYTGIQRDLLFSNNKEKRVRYARHMLYHILREKCGESSYSLAKMFGRSRRNIVRGLSSIKDSIGIYKNVKIEFDNIVKKIEDTK